MRDKDLYKQILRIQTPWEVTEVELSVDAGEVTVQVEREAGTQHLFESIEHAQENVIINRGGLPFDEVQ